MLLRFEEDFHQRYIDGISIHDTFTKITYDQTFNLIQQYILNKEHQEAILNVLQSRPNTDVYYRVNYRVTDYYVIRWLRALGSKVEVLLPWNLRQKMTSMMRSIVSRSRFGNFMTGVCNWSIRS